MASTPTQPNDNDSGQGHSSKGPRTASTYHRRRAVAACQPCRARKTKCDNIRPRCGFCTRTGAQCTYADATSDYSSFDPASLAILDRLNHVVSLLEKPSQLPAAQALSAEPVAASPQISCNSALPDNYAPEDPDFDHDLLEKLPSFPASINSCEATLKWPILQDIVPQIESFVLCTEDDAMDPRPHSAMLGRGVQEEDFIPLSKRFLSYVHIKNPILDVPRFMDYVQIASQTGLQWDGPSCLVLIACSLGCIATPYSPMAKNASATASSTPRGDMETCTAYYLAAKKRLGIMEPSLISIQCLFLCGVLEMYLVNALGAWNYFNQACVQFRNLLWRERIISGGQQVGFHEEQRLKERLYWSCLKSERELRCEIPLPSSDFYNLGFPSSFPSPPDEVLSPPTSLATGGTEDYEGERSWFYYLADISFRRIMDRAFTAFACDGEAGWIQNFERGLKRYDAFRDQIDAWYRHIPPQIDIDQSDNQNSELAHHVRVRALICQEWIHRPFLYHALHQPSSDPHMAVARPLAERCLQLCVECQLTVHPFHRHHGTWYVARTSMTRALLLLAAGRSDKVALPDRWREALDCALGTLRYWAEGAPDLRRAAGVLSDMIDEL